MNAATGILSVKLNNGVGIPQVDLGVFQVADNGTQACVETALELGYRHIDTATAYYNLIDWPVPGRGLYGEVWRAFEKLLADGAVGAVGVSSALPEHIDRMVSESDVVPAVDQVELHPTFREPATVEQGRAHGIAPEACSPLGQGADLEAPAVVSIANALGVTPGQVVLRRQVQHGVTLTPKSVNSERMATDLSFTQI